MQITITKEEYREIIRAYLINMLTESKEVEQTQETKNDRLCMLLKMMEIAEKNNMEIDFMKEQTEEDMVSYLRKQAKRTYTSNYWNYLEVFEEIVKNRFN